MVEDKYLQEVHRLVSLQGGKSWNSPEIQAYRRTQGSILLHRLYLIGNFDMSPQCFEKDDLHDQIYHPGPQTELLGEMSVTIFQYTLQKFANC